MHARLCACARQELLHYVYTSPHTHPSMRTHSLARVPDTCTRACSARAGGLQESRCLPPRRSRLRHCRTAGTRMVAAAPAAAHRSCACTARSRARYGELRVGISICAILHCLCVYVRACMCVCVLVCVCSVYGQIAAHACACLCARECACSARSLAREAGADAPPGGAPSKAALGQALEGCLVTHPLPLRHMCRAHVCKSQGRAGQGWTGAMMSPA